MWKNIWQSNDLSAVAEQLTVVFLINIKLYPFLHQDVQEERIKNQTYHQELKKIRYQVIRYTHIYDGNLNNSSFFEAKYFKESVKQNAFGRQRQQATLSKKDYLM